MEIKQFKADAQYLDNLIGNLTNQYINLDYSDIVNIKKCKDISIYTASKDASFQGDSDEFLQVFIEKAKNLLAGQTPHSVLISLSLERDASITMEAMASFNDFFEVFTEEVEVKWGIAHIHDDIPMYIVIAVGTNPEEVCL